MIGMADLTAFVQVLFIDLVLAGDNAIVVGMAAASVPLELRRKVVLWGVAAAVCLRILFAVGATKLLAVIGLTLAGGLLLGWVCWKMWRELKAAKEGDVPEQPEDGPGTAPKTVRQAVIQVAMADLSMSLDNVLAVAGAAGEHLWVLVAGLLLSVVLMGVAASFIAGLLVRYRWIAYGGLAVITYVALSMIWRGGIEVANAMV